MKIKIISFGKMDDKNAKGLFYEYLSRIKHYSNIENLELSEFFNGDIKSNQAKNEESIHAKMNDQKTEYILLDIKGKSIKSEDLSKIIIENKDFKSANLTFIIGPSDGFSDEFRNKFTNKISLGRITLPHQLCKVVLLEQIYRGFKINGNEKYHK